MLKRHPTCRWRSEKIRNRKYFVLVEGYAWMNQVYFQKEKSFIDADVDLFENRIKQYEELLEKYKMELTEWYIEAGYPYDNFFHKN